MFRNIWFLSNLEHRARHLFGNLLEGKIEGAECTLGHFHVGGTLYGQFSQHSYAPAQRIGNHASAVRSQTGDVAGVKQVEYLGEVLQLFVKCLK